MNTETLLALYDEHQRIRINYPGARKDSFPDLVRFVNPPPAMNYVLYSHLAEPDLDAAIDAQVDFFSQLNQPFSWHVCDHDSPPNLKNRLIAHGFAADDDPDAVMVLDKEDMLPALLQVPQTDVRRISALQQLDAVIQIEEQVLGGDLSWLRKRLGAHLEIAGYISIYVAYADGRPASAGWIYFYPRSQFAGLFGGATLPDCRGRGLYTAVLATRVQEAVRRGYRLVTTGAGPMSLPILTRNGFRVLTYSHALEWKGRSGV